MRDKTTYTKEGDKQSHWIGNAHKKQRKAGGKNDYYGNKAKKEMVSKYQKMDSKKEDSDDEHSMSEDDYSRSDSGGNKEESKVSKLKTKTNRNYNNKSKVASKPTKKSN